MLAMRPRLRAPLLVGVGAAFDFHAGLVPQAPGWMQRAGLEWLYRLWREPRRLLALILPLRTTGERRASRQRTRGPRGRGRPRSDADG